MKEILANIDLDLAQQVGKNLGIEVPDTGKSFKTSSVEKSAKLSFEAFVPEDIKARKIAVLVHDKVNEANVAAILAWAQAESAVAHILTPTPAPVLSNEQSPLPSNGMQKAEPSVMYDAVVIVDGDNYNAVKADGVATHYILEAYKHLKPIVFLGDKKALVEDLRLVMDKGTVVTEDFNSVNTEFKDLIRAHRVWEREMVAEAIPA